MSIRNYAAIFVSLSTLTVGGCVERLITVTTRPTGAVVWLNDQEVGTTPVTVPFSWYGSYDLVIRKDGLKTIKTSRKPPVPVYQWPVLDFFAECVLPLKFVDYHRWHYDLKPHGEVDSELLVQRARELREESIQSP